MSKNITLLKPSLDNLAYRYKFDSRLLALEEKNGAQKNVELLKRRLERTKDDIMLYVVQNYGMEFDEMYKDKEEDPDGEKPEASEP